MSPPCRIEMLGGLKVLIEDRVITRFQTQKTGALLAFLALNHGKSFSRERVAELLWPDGDSTAIRNRLNQAVSSLRRQLHPPGTEPGAILVADHLTISINAPAVSTDVAEFEATLREASTLEGDEAAPVLRRAVDLYQGEFLDGSHEDWAISERVVLADRCYEALTKLIRIYAYSGRLPDAIEIASRRLAQDPGEERSHRALMKLYVMAGRPRSALAQFTELERALAAEGDVPSERALKLRTEALAAAESEDAPAPVVKDVSSGPAPKSKPWFPEYATPFFGREEELDTIRGMLADGQQLVTLTGLGGVGKTRLAVEAVGPLRCEDLGIGFVSAADVETPSALMEELENTVGVVRGSSPGSRAVVVLDNIEPPIRAQLKGLTQFLSVNPLISLVVTSRTPLGTSGERVLPVPPLPVALEGSLVELARSPSIAMFVSRAQAVRQDFQLTERNRNAIVDLTAKLEGWPLAIELAAGWARGLSPSQMAERISENYNLLASRRKDIHARHRSLRAAIDGSYHALSDELQHDFRRLSVFEGGWDHYAAAAVMPGSDVHQALSALEDAGLVKPVGKGSSDRYQMLESVRTFARDLTSPDLASEIRRLHAEHFRAIVSRSTRKGPSGVAAIKRDRPNVLAALRYWIEGEYEDMATSMGIDLGYYWDLSGRIEEGVGWMERVLPLAHSQGESSRGLLLTRYARLLWNRGEFERATALYAEALAIFERAEDLEGVLETTVYLAQDAHRQGDFPRAAELLLQNIERARQLGEPWAEARSHLALGNSLIELGKLGEAQQAYETCLELGRSVDEASLIGASLGNLGNLMRLRGNLDEADVYLQSATEIYEAAGLRSMTIDSHLMRAQLMLMRGEPAETIEHVRRALRIGVEGAYSLWTAFHLAASALSRLGRTEAAAHLFGHAEHLWFVDADRGGIEPQAYRTERARLESELGLGATRTAMEAGRALGHAGAVALTMTDVA